ncbi:NADH-quinone oxidoreductase subunit C [bacterium]|nr:NADH-quinone oxidoreductase subunit C [bacterium]
MNWIIINNNTQTNALDLPTASIDEIKADFKNMNLRLIAFFGKQEFDNVRLYIALADDKVGKIYLTSTLFEKHIKSYESFTSIYPQFHNFEREFYEEFGIEPLNHPWLKPLRKDQDKYSFFEMRGDEVHQVAVGPIHAGVIEPGHFRFMCHGEKVYDLEIMLGYQYKGIEKLLLKKSPLFKNRLAESICGDSVIANNIAYSQVMEILSGTKVTNRSEIIRRIALELERIAVHIGDMGAIAGDIAYQMGASIFGVTRTLVINTMLEISGSRFGRGLIDVGGVNFNIDKTMADKLLSMLEDVKKTVDRTTNTMLKSSTVISRLERTGVVSTEVANSLGAVGLAARASGVDIDSRFDFNDKWYTSLDVVKPFKATGDVYSRFKLRYKEIKQSIKIVKSLLKNLEIYKEEFKIIPNNKLASNSFAISIVEGWRGEIIHIALTGADGEILRYKIKDPSFNNWYMLAMAVRNNGISDFPLCNKSFNLSYCGHDL